MADLWLTLSWAAIICLATWSAVEGSTGRARLRRTVRCVREATLVRRGAALGVEIPVIPGRGPLGSVGAALRGALRGPPRLPDADTLALMALEVSARLQAGADVAGAWAQTWTRLASTEFLGVGADGAPLNLVSDGRRRWWRWRPTWRGEDAAAAGAAALVTACRFSFLSGAPIAEVLRQVAGGLSDSARARREQERAFVGPQLSARILTSLPLLAIAGGEFLGAGPLAWFVSGGIGSAAALGGACLVLLGHETSRRMIVAAKRRATDRMAETILCDLARAGLHSGASIPTVLFALADAGNEPELRRVSRELSMGAAWSDAWQPMPPRSQLLALGLQPGWEQGVSPVTILAHAAEQARQRQLATAEEEAGKLSVKLVVPLGLFLLPAFVALGIVPVVFALLSSELGV